MQFYERLLGPTSRRIKLMITRGVVSLVDSNAAMQMLQVKVMGVPFDAEHWEPYGFTAKPKPGAEALVGAVNGRTGHLVAFSVADRRFRLKGLADGEVALFDDLDNMVKLGRDAIEITGTMAVHVTAPEVTVTSDNITLGEAGGAKVARVGDRVNVGAGSSQGLWPIVEGSDKVSAA